MVKGLSVGLIHSCQSETETNTMRMMLPQRSYCPALIVTMAGVAEILTSVLYTSFASFGICDQQSGEMAPWLATTWLLESQTQGLKWRLTELFLIFILTSKLVRVHSAICKFSF